MPNYPAIFYIDTPDGVGEARKDKLGEPWNITYPGGGMRFYGSFLYMKRESIKRIKTEMNYPKTTTIIFYSAKKQQKEKQK